jgi:hypothetical protein
MPGGGGRSSGSVDSEVVGQVGPSNRASSTFDRIRRSRPGVICCALYAVLAIATYGFGSVGSSRIAGVKWNDSVEQIWWLGWVAHALPNVHNLFLAQGQNYPNGQNFGVNGSMLALGVLFAPITKIFGPVVTFNVLLRLALAASAASMCFVLRRWTSWWPAAFVGGLLYGFSAYTSTFGSDLFLVFVPLPPLTLMVLHEIFVRQRWRARSAGIVLGLLCVLQFFIWVEVLAGTVVIGVLTVAVLLVTTRDKFAARWRYAIAAATYSVAVAGVLLAYPLWFTFAGAQSIHGSPQSPWFLASFNTDLLSPFMAGTHQWLVPAVIGGSDNAHYLGISLVLVLGCFAVFLRSRKEILFAGAMAVIAFVLSLGSPLTIDDHKTSITLPFVLFEHLPALSGIEARRFALYTDLFVAAMFAIGMDELWRRVRVRVLLVNRPLGGVKTALATSALGALMLAVTLPLVPTSAQGTTSIHVPDFFTSKAVDAIPSGGVDLAYPYPDFASNTPLALLVKPIDSVMLDQAVSGMRFNLIGGFGWFPSSSGTGGTSYPAHLTPRSVQALFDSSYYGRAPPKTDITTDLRNFLRKYHVESVLVIPPGDLRFYGVAVHPKTAVVISRLIAVIGKPKDIGGVTVWLHVGQRLGAAGP